MKSFVFQYPLVLLLLFLVIPVWLSLRYAQQRRVIVLRELGELGELSSEVFWRDGLRIAALVLLILALARPGVNPQPQSVTQSGRDVVFVLDVSRSMLAADVAPNRLEVAKNSIRDALDHLTSERVALVVYAGSANILCPLTFDHNFVRYMLDQATTRAVDFGGTTLLAAVEKCVDNVLTKGRYNMHDLIVFTDGEEHGDSADRVGDLLESNGVGLLLVGIGDDMTGARIPVLDDDGQQTFLQYKGELVTTKLQSLELKEFALGIDQAVYQNVGTGNFDLPGYYYDFVADKPARGALGDDVFVVYQEAGFLLMWLAILFLCISERGLILLGKKGVISAVVLWQLGVVVADDPLGDSYMASVDHQEAGRYSEALEGYAQIVENHRLSNQQLAVLSFNRGLCYLQQAEIEATAQQIETAHSQAQQAQSLFLAARRLDPEFDRPGQRLDLTAKLIAVYKQELVKEKKREQALQERIEELVERLKGLKKSQLEVIAKIPARRKRNPIMPDNAAAESKSLQVDQDEVIAESIEVNAELIEIDNQVSSSQSPTVLVEPRQLMVAAIDSQKRAYPQLKQWATWLKAEVDQRIAVDKIQAIIDLLSNGNEGESGDENWDEEEYWDESENSASEGSQAASIDGSGEFAGASEMQALPVPNYSVEDILQQERGALQFRQQQRAAKNKGKIDKDW